MVLANPPAKQLIQRLGSGKGANAASFLKTCSVARLRQCLVMEHRVSAYAPYTVYSQLRNGKESMSNSDAVMEAELVTADSLAG